MIKSFLIFLIRIYQKTISPNHGFLKFFWPPYLRCRYYPTCSQYIIEALDKKGFSQGLLLGIRRILRCNALSTSQGGHDSIFKTNK